MTYVVHYIGEWQPNGANDRVFNPSWTKQYTNLDDMEIFFRHYFNQMIKEGEVVLHSGVHVFQIQNR